MYFLILNATAAEWLSMWLFWLLNDLILYSYLWLSSIQIHFQYIITLRILINCVISHTTQSNLKLGTLDMYLYKLLFYIFRWTSSGCLRGAITANWKLHIMLIFWNIFWITIQTYRYQISGQWKIYASLLNGFVVCAVKALLLRTFSMAGIIIYRYKYWLLKHTNITNLIIMNWQCDS